MACNNGYVPHTRSVPLSFLVILQNQEPYEDIRFSRKLLIRLVRGLDAVKLIQSNSKMSRSNKAVPAKSNNNCAYC